MSTQGKMKDRSLIQVREPQKYQVIMHNDDFTPMDFVVDILMELFEKTEDEAERLMLEVHEGQKAVVGVYSYDIARTKVNLAIQRARKEGYPFRVTMEEC